MFSSFTFIGVKNFSKYGHKVIFPSSIDNTYIKKYIIKSSLFLTKINIHIILTIFIIVFLITIFLNSSSP